MKLISKKCKLWELIILVMIFIAGCTQQAGNGGSMDLLQKADDHFKKNDIDKAKELYLETAAVAEKEKNNSAPVEAYSQIARCYLKQNEIAEGLNWLDRAKAKATPDEPEGWSRYLSVRGRFEWKKAAAEAKELTPEVKQAASTFKEMYDYCLEHKLHERAIDAANMIAIVGGADDRIEWGLKGIKAAEAGNLDGWLGPLWNNHGWNLNDMGEYEKSLEGLKKAREYHYKGEKELPKLIADWSVGYAYRMTGQIDSALTLMTKVSEWANRLYDAKPSDENTEWVGFANKELGEIALIKGQNKLALKYFQKAKDNLAKVGMPDWDVKGFQELNDQIDKLKLELEK